MRILDKRIIFKSRETTADSRKRRSGSGELEEIVGMVCIA